MEKQHLKRYFYSLGIILLLTGILLLLLMSGTLQFMGIIFISAAYVYFVSIYFSDLSDQGDKHFRSRTLDQILKFHFWK